MSEFLEIEIIKVFWSEYLGKKDYYVTILGKSVATREYVTFKSCSFSDQDVDRLKAALAAGRKVRISSENGMTFLEVNHFRLIIAIPRAWSSLFSDNVLASFVS